MRSALFGCDWHYMEKRERTNLAIILLPIKSLLSSSIYYDGDYYIGEHKDGDRHGQGTHCSAYGTKYVGEWKDDKRQGKGTEYTAEGQIFREGVWAEYKYVGKG